MKPPIPKNYQEARELMGGFALNVAIAEYSLYGKVPTQFTHWNWEVIIGWVTASTRNHCEVMYMLTRILENLP